MSRHEDLQSLLDELGKELQQAKAQVGEERKNVYDLQTQLEVPHMYIHSIGEWLAYTHCSVPASAHSRVHLYMQVPMC